MPPSNITYRPASPADADEIASVYLASRQAFLPYAPIAHPEEGVRHYIRRLVSSPEKVKVTVPVADGRILGLIALERDGDHTWVQQFYLHPGVVGQGIGSHLMDQAKAEFGPPIRLWTFQQNTGARQFYQRHGFRVLTFTDGAENEEHCPDVLFEWEGS